MTSVIVSMRWFQSPRGDFGFLKRLGEWLGDAWDRVSFNPLAGILVF